MAQRQRISGAGPQGNRAIAQLDVERMLDEAEEIRREAEASASNQSTATDYLIMTDVVARDKATLATDRLNVEQRDDESKRRRLATEKEEEASRTSRALAHFRHSIDLALFPAITPRASLREGRLVEMR